MLFTLPASGVRFCHTSRWSLLEPASPLRFGLVSRVYHESFAFDKWRVPNPLLEYYTSPPSELLRPPLINRQFYLEDMPVFFGTNNFYFDVPSTMYKFLARISTERKQHIRQISFVHHNVISIWTPAACRQLHRQLQSLPGLRRLNISIDEQDWLTKVNKERNERQRARCGEGPIEMYTELTNMPGIKELMELGGLDEVNFHGNCAATEQLLKSNMLKSMAEKKAEAANRE
ncbi:hypothetical protein EJ03DRAFT_381521 [Teratosphaeria nubilosa]|uniref:Uncharacterized protein n=1 Tax=Teratosphaeria nubilosa TaxID=161662 RepID=A0A6G1LEG3_9PEZI|nr:hypothetical protein EJ03DRAFT_381521 [Teratosphaeria nubilosa]